MVHRIHNRNPGYSDFNNLGTSSSFNFKNSTANHVTDGATALKLEDEIQQESQVDSKNAAHEDFSAVANSDVINESNIKANEIVDEDLTDNVQDKNSTNGLENFGIDEIEESTPDLFNSDDNSVDNEEFTSFEKTKPDDDKEDDLEIPAFLRRQKN